jgi:hypothetical protein
MHADGRCPGNNQGAQLRGNNVELIAQRKFIRQTVAASKSRIYNGDGWSAGQDSPQKLTDLLFATWWCRGESQHARNVAAERSSDADMCYADRRPRIVDIPGLDQIALLMEVLSLVRAGVALSWKLLHRSELHVLVLGGLREEGAGLLRGSGLAAAAHDVDKGIGGA